MADKIKLEAESSEDVGASRQRAKRAGRVSAVIYGQNKKPTAIHVEEKALVKALGTGHFFNSVVMVDGQRTLPKDVHFHPVTDRPLHVDFLRIGEHSTVTVAVPIVFTAEDESPGMKHGGVLNIARHEVEIVVDAADIPSQIAVSLAGRDIGDAILLRDIKLPPGAAAADLDGDIVVGSIVANEADDRVILELAVEATRVRYEELLGKPMTHLGYVTEKMLQATEAINVQ